MFNSEQFSGKYMGKLGLEELEVQVSFAVLNLQVTFSL